jgi:hypothetical protein
MLVNELGAVVDLVVNNNQDILLGVVLGNILVGVFLGGHLDGECCAKENGIPGVSRFFFFFRFCKVCFSVVARRTSSVAPEVQIQTGQDKEGRKKEREEIWRW